MSPIAYSKEIAAKAAVRGLTTDGPSVSSPISAGLPSILPANAPFSAAIITAVGGQNTLFDETTLIGDFEGEENLTADRSNKVFDFSPFQPIAPDLIFTRAAISEHTIANGFNENIFYIGDSVGNVYVGSSTTLGTQLPTGSLTVLNLPTILNAFGTLNSDDQIVITGIAVNPVSDLTAFANVNGSFSTFANQVGELLLVTFWDTGGGLRLTTNNQLVRSGLLAFPIADVVSPAQALPGIQSDTGFPVTVGGSFGVAFSIYGNLAGVAVDDDGSVYYQQVDLIQFTGGNIVKVTDTGTNQDRSTATNGILTTTTLNPVGGQYGSASGPASQVNRFTNFSGTSTTFGNIAAIAAGRGNTLYAALARSFVSTDSNDVKDTEGPFTNPSALKSTPSLIVSFADATGGFDTCTSPGVGQNGALPVGDGFADVTSSKSALSPGVNNFVVFAQGTGPKAKPAGKGILRLSFQVDYSIYSGLTVDEEGKVYLVSGGSPAAVGTDPSRYFGEVLVFPDQFPYDRKADFVDLRGDLPPNPPLDGGNTGDGDSDRYDHIFWQAPVDQLTVTPTGIAGLARGFLLYLNRTRNDATVFASLPNGSTQGDDTSHGPIYFGEFDASKQVAGGDDANPTFKGDDAGTGGTPALPAGVDGGFEFSFAGIVAAVCTSPWNGFFLNSNGSISFNAGDATNIPTTASFVSGVPRLAAAWTDLNTTNRPGGAVSTNFPVQALGFAGINNFMARWINVPEFGFEGCSKNTFSVSLLDDGTGTDENATASQEGPTDLRYTKDPITGKSLAAGVGLSPRADGTGHFCYDYGRMDLLGTASHPVLTGFTIGFQPPPAPAETDLGQTTTALVGTGAQASLYEFFDLGLAPPGTIPAIPDFDLRYVGNDSKLSTPATQVDRNRDRLCFFGAGC